MADPLSWQILTGRLDLPRYHESGTQNPLPQPSGRGVSPRGAAPFILCLQPLEALLARMTDWSRLHINCLLSWQGDRVAAAQEKCAAFSSIIDFQMTGWKACPTALQSRSTCQEHCRASR